MKTQFISRYIGMAAVLAVIVGCKPEITSTKDSYSSGTADFSTFVAVGNSLTAGYTDGALSLYGQQNSYPSILAQQFKVAGGGAFNQPLLADANGNGVGILGTSVVGHLYLKTLDLSTNPPTIDPEPTVAGNDPSSTAWLYTGDKSQLNNFAVPGTTLITALFPGYGNPTNGPGNFNPYFTRFAANLSTSSVVGDAAARKPTFFVMDLGNNDVLGYASAGGKGTITDQATFSLAYSQALTTLLASGTNTKALITTLPDVTSIPYLTTVGPVVAAKLVKSYPADALIFPYVTHLIPAPGGIAAASANDLIQGKVLVTLQGQIWLSSNVPSAINPVPDQYVLDPLEIAACQAAVSNFNNSITAAATAANSSGIRVSVFDVYNFFKNVIGKGAVIDGVPTSAAFIQGNFFGLDGVHPTPRGYAITANYMIDQINKDFGSNIPKVNSASYNAVILPQ